MPVTITVRNVPDDIRDELATRAVRSGRSLQEYLLAHLIEMTSRPTMEEVVGRVRERVMLARTTLEADTILAVRDRNRR